MIIIYHDRAFLPFEFTMSAVGEPRFSAGSIANRFAYCVNARNDYFLFFSSSAQFTFYRIILHVEWRDTSIERTDPKSYGIRMRECVLVYVGTREMSRFNLR